MATPVVVNGDICHLYTQVYSTDIGTRTRSRSFAISFTDQTYLLGHSVTSVDSFFALYTGRIPCGVGYAKIGHLNDDLVLY